MTIQEFIKEHNITSIATKIHANPFSEHKMWSKDASHYEIVLNHCPNIPGKPAKEKTFITYFSQGSAHKGKPSIDSVLDCLVSDSDCLQYSFEDWAMNLGYSPDSIQALKVYNACKEQSLKLKDFLGSDLMQKLQDCDRL